jgi:hypothetical protein
MLWLDEDKFVHDWYGVKKSYHILGGTLLGKQL